MICYLDNWGKLSIISSIVKEILTLLTTYIYFFALLKLMFHIIKISFIFINKLLKWAEFTCRPNFNNKSKISYKKAGWNIFKIS